MRALILAPGRYPDIHTYTGGRPLEMTCLVDRPFLQHVVEALVTLGVTRLDVAVSERPELVERLLGTGERWGASVTYHLVGDSDRSYRPLRSLLAEEGDLWIVHADRLPSHAALEQALMSDHARGAMIDARLDPVADWSGWAFLPAGTRPPFAGATSRADLQVWLESLGASRISARDCLSVRSSADVLAAHAALLDGRFPGVLISGREVAPAVRVARTARLPPDVELVAPVYIGESSLIGSGARIGPYAVVEREAIVEADSAVENALVRAGSYVGSGLGLKDSIVDGDRLISLSHGVAMEIRDDHLIGALPGSPPLDVARLIERLLAASLFVISLPVILLTASWLTLFGERPVLRSIPIASAPSSPVRRPNSFVVRTLDPLFGVSEARCRSRILGVLLRFLPGLPYVVAGKIRLVGVQPRRPEALGDLPEEWRALYLRSEVGLITEADVNDLVRESPDLMFAGEAYSASRPGWRYAALLCLAYLRGRGAATRSAGALRTLTMAGVDK